MLSENFRKHFYLFKIIFKIYLLVFILHIFVQSILSIMSKAEKTRQFIIEKTAVLFNTKGYAGTSLSDITEATGLTKGSIYGNFENKDEVSKEVYLYNAKRLQSAFEYNLNSEMTSEEKLMTILDFYRNSLETNLSRGGCPLMNTAIEADDTIPFLKKEVAKSFGSWSKKLIEILEEGKIKNEIKDSINTSDYSFLFIMLIEGGILLSKTTNNQNHLFQALDRIRKIIDSEILK